MDSENNPLLIFQFLYGIIFLGWIFVIYAGYFIGSRQLGL